MSDYNQSTKFIDLVAQQDRIKSEILAAISDVLSSGSYIMGPQVSILEKKLSEYTGANNTLTCANGTDAISIAMMSWGVGNGDVVFVPSFTYVASAEAPAQLGAIPFFVDVKRDTFNLDPESLKQAILDCKENALRPKAIVAVDLFGQPCDLEEISTIAKENNLKLLVDSAQSFGGEYFGKKVGVFGDATTTSFFPAKPLGCYGDGGAIFINDEEYVEVMNSIRLHGRGAEKYDNVRIGLNSRLDTIQAAILLEKLKIFDNELTLRNNIATKYTEILTSHLDTPYLGKGIKSAWAQYTVKIQDRDTVKNALKDKFPTVIYYPIPLSQQTGYEAFPRVSSGLAVSELLPKEVLSLPMHPYLTEDQINYICENLINALRG